MAAVGTMFQRRFGDNLGQIEAKELVEAIRASDRGGYRDRREFFSELLADLPWRKRAGIGDLEEFWDHEYPEAAKLMDGALDTLTRLKSNGHKLGIVTNGGTRVQSRKVDAVSIGHLIDTVVISESVGTRKPDPEIFRLALANVDAEPQEAWFIGDNPEADVIGASRIGMTAVWMRGSHDWPVEHPEPTLQIDSLPELPHLLPRPPVA